MPTQLDEALDEAFDAAGVFGRFQIIMLVVITGSKFLVAPGIQMLSLEGNDQDWWCADGMGDKLEMKLTLSSWRYHACYLNRTKCETFLYDGNSRTLVHEYDLVCAKRGSIQSMLLTEDVGILLGSLWMGQIAEMFGRRPTFLASILMHILALGISLINTHSLIYASALCVLGFSKGGLSVVTLSLPVEFIGTRWRAAALGFPSFAVGSIFLALCTYTFGDWRLTTIAIIIVTVPFVSGWIMVPESAHWLVSRGRVAEASDVMRIIANVNGKASPDLKLLEELADEPKIRKQAKTTHTYIDLFKSKEISKLSIQIILIWLVLGISFHLLTAAVKSLERESYFSLLLSGIIDVPNLYLTIAIITVIGRRKSSCVTFALGALASVAVLPMVYIVGYGDRRGNVITGLAVASQFGIGCAWASVSLHTAEVFPTSVRSLGLGVGNAAARVGAMMAPLLLSLDQAKGTLMFFVVGLLSMTAAILCLNLPETTGKPLRTLVEQAGDKHSIKDEVDQAFLTERCEA